MKNRIRDLDESHRNFRVTIFRQYGYYQRVESITVLIYSLVVQEGGNAGSRMVRHPDANGVVRLQYSIRVTVIYGHHRHNAICDLHNDPNTE